MGPVGTAAAFVKGGKTTPLPSWVSDEEFATRAKILANGGYRGPLNWYKAAMRAVNAADEAEVPHEQKFCSLPTMLVVSDQDYVTRADMQIPKSEKWCPQLQIETFDCGHWVQLEKPDEVTKLLKQFASKVVDLQANGNGATGTNMMGELEKVAGAAKTALAV
jgi:soluble epoxide hydrolase/lipid-phosphate phosphatase